jgi:hypothetical protein
MRKSYIPANEPTVAFGLRHLFASNLKRMKIIAARMEVTVEDVVNKTIALGCAIIERNLKAKEGGHDDAK